VGIGCAVSLWLYNMNDDYQKSKAAFILFIGKPQKKFFDVICKIFVQ
jgi:hypothetical protein